MLTAFTSSTIVDEMVMRSKPDFREAHRVGVEIGSSVLRSQGRPLDDQSVLDLVQLQHVGYRAAEQGLDEAVRMARRNGKTWEEIGLRLGMTKQGAQQRFGPKMGDDLGDDDG